MGTWIMSKIIITIPRSTWINLSVIQRDGGGERTKLSVEKGREVRTVDHDKGNDKSYDCHCGEGVLRRTMDLGYSDQIRWECKEDEKLR